MRTVAAAQDSGHFGSDFVRSGSGFVRSDSGSGHFGFVRSGFVRSGSGSGRSGSDFVHSDFDSGHSGFDLVRLQDSAGRSGRSEDSAGWVLVDWQPLYRIIGKENGKERLIKAVEYGHLNNFQNFFRIF